MDLGLLRVTADTLLAPALTCNRVTTKAMNSRMHSSLSQPFVHEFESMSSWNCGSRACRYLHRSQAGEKCGGAGGRMGEGRADGVRPEGQKVAEEDVGLDRGGQRCRPRPLCKYTANRPRLDYLQLEVLAQARVARKLLAHRRQQYRVLCSSGFGRFGGG